MSEEAPATSHNSTCVGGVFPGLHDDVDHRHWHQHWTEFVSFQCVYASSPLSLALPRLRGVAEVAGDRTGNAEPSGFHYL